MILLLVIPIVFLLIVDQTSGTDLISIDLFFQKSTEQILLSQYDVNLVFIGVAVNGFLNAYFALLLFHNNFDFFKYCMGTGLHPLSFVTGRTLFFFTVNIVLAVIISLTISGMLQAEQHTGLFLGFLFVGIIYGIIGGIMGLLSSDFMIAILGVVLLANLDAGWLQNPVFYSTAQSTDLIRWLPAFYPSQLVFSSAFTDQWNGWAVIQCAIIALILLSVLFSILKIQIRNINPWWHQ